MSDEPISITILEDSSPIIITTAAEQGPVGPQGVPGPVGGQGEDGRGLRWQGPFDGSNYVVNDAVEFQGSSYVCISNTNQNPIDAPADWDLAAQAGLVGNTGGQGVGLANIVVIANNIIQYTNTDNVVSNAGQIIVNDGIDGQDGISIVNVDASSGYLITTFSNSATANAGYIRGNTGAAGVGIIAVDSSNGHLNIQYSNSVISNVGYVRGPQGNTVTDIDYKPTIAATDIAFCTYGEPALDLTSTNATAPINGVEVTFSNTTTGQATYSTPYALEEDMAADINDANIPFIEAYTSTNVLYLKHTRGGDINIVNGNPDSTGKGFGGLNSGSGVPLVTIGEGYVAEFTVYDSITNANTTYDIALPKGENGNDGSNANVTYTNVISALTFVPANSNSLTSETNSRISADNVITNSIASTDANVATEKAARISADNIITNNIIPPIQSNVATLQSNVVTLTARQTVTSANIATALGFTPLQHNEAIVITGDGNAVANSTSLNLVLGNSGVSAGSYTLPNMTVDQKGRVTSISNATSIRATSSAPNMSYSNATTSIVSGNATVDVSSATFFEITLTQNIGFIITNPPTTNSEFSVHVIYNGTGYSISWPASIKWPDGTQPTLSSGSGKVDIFVFRTLNGGTTWFGAVVGQNY